uniref:NADH dehydrogenase subunit 6 n=1 Tax=Hypsosinga pygmaea TaxID=336661 RepID=A0A0U2KNJ2_9ARAC|nr:NADH dehydrogenase subunit 6 [Hypsosinga pygmaea]ALF36397.1 NADH dehydrogenase subunit 6 [Hypsosinga pygmaea]
MKMIIMMGMLFMLSNQPMMIIGSLIFIVLLYSLLLYWMFSSFWFSYMVILVMMSGVLVIFSYMMSILPNESFEISGLLFLFLEIFLIYKTNYSSEFVQDVSLEGVKIWWNCSLMYSLFLVMYLLLMMVMVVWISLMERGAIRIL